MGLGYGVTLHIMGLGRCCLTLHIMGMGWWCFTLCIMGLGMVTHVTHKGSGMCDVF
jgi:hypothetical protein